MCSKAAFGLFLGIFTLAVPTTGCLRQNPLFAVEDAGGDPDLGVLGPSALGPGVDGAGGPADLGTAPADGAAAPDLALVCGADTVDCDGNPANGCETVAANDPGEPANDTCDGAANLGTVPEGSHVTGGGRVLVPGDLDLFIVSVEPGLHACVGEDTLDYTVRATLAGPPGVDLSLRGALDPSECSTSWSDWAKKTVCFHFSDSCALPQTQVISLEVGSQTDDSSCLPYAVEVTFCAQGQPCPGC